MKKYTVNQLAKEAKITVRTLHYYDQINLLKPSQRSDKGYRLYDFQDKLKLQQILFYKEIGLSLNQIKTQFDNPNYDPYQTLKAQKKEIEQKLYSYKKLLKTLEKTIKNFNPNQMSHDLYEGLPDETKKHRQEAIQRWGDKVIQSENNLSKLTPKQKEGLIQEGKDIANKLGEALKQNKQFNSQNTQDLIKSYHKHMQNFYDCTPEIFKNLGQMYVDDPRFTKYYEDITPGLANYVNQAIQYYVSKL